MQITETRSCDDLSFTASVKAKQASSQADALTLLAGSRAWLLVTEKLVADERWAAALSCSKQAVAELGKAYRDPRGGTRDDTTLKLSSAEEQEAAGNVGAAARVTRKVLVSRVAMLAAKLADELEE